MVTSRKVLEKELLDCLQREQHLRTQLRFLKENFDEAVNRAVAIRLEKEQLT